MKKIILTLAFITAFVSLSAVAETSTRTGDALVTVNGLVCDFCARALEKVFSKEVAVKAIDVNLDTKIITINFNDGQSLSDDRVTELVLDSGYNVEGIERAE